MEVDDLYGLPLDRFVPERGELARALKAAGKREESARVAKLRKPSVAAWAVNQLVRTQRGAVGELFEAGTALRNAHEELLAGRGDGETLRNAGEQERAAVDALVHAARGLLTTQGHELGAAVIDRVADTLHAAALDDDAREQVRVGRLERELRHVGLGMAAPPAVTRPARRTPDRSATRAGADAANAAEAARATRAREADARRRADRAARELRAAEERHQRAEAAVRAAEETLASARAEAKAAADAHRRAQAEVSRARR